MATKYVSYRKPLQTRLGKEKLMCKGLEVLCVCMINILAMFKGPLTFTSYLIDDIYLKRVKNNEHSENMIFHFHFTIKIALLIQFARRSLP